MRLIHLALLPDELLHMLTGCQQPIATIVYLIIRRSIVANLYCQ
jgi:hypothetical protein